MKPVRLLNSGRKTPANGRVETRSSAGVTFKLYICFGYFENDPGAQNGERLPATKTSLAYVAYPIIKYTCSRPASDQSAAAYGIRRRGPIFYSSATNLCSNLDTLKPPALGPVFRRSLPVTSQSAKSCCLADAAQGAQQLLLRTAQLGARWLHCKASAGADYKKEDSQLSCSEGVHPPRRHRGVCNSAGCTDGCTVSWATSATLANCTRSFIARRGWQECTQEKSSLHMKSVHMKNVYKRSTSKLNKICQLAKFCDSMVIQL